MNESAVQFINGVESLEYGEIALFRCCYVVTIVYSIINICLQVLPTMVLRRGMHLASCLLAGRAEIPRGVIPIA